MLQWYFRALADFYVRVKKYQQQGGRRNGDQRQQHRQRHRGRPEQQAEATSRSSYVELEGSLPTFVRYSR